MNNTKDLCVNPLKSHVQCNKWGPDEDSAPDFALNSYCRCLGYQAAQRTDSSDQFICARVVPSAQLPVLFCKIIRRQQLGFSSQDFIMKVFDFLIFMIIKCVGGLQCITFMLSQFLKIIKIPDVKISCFYRRRHLQLSCQTALLLL